MKANSCRRKAWTMAGLLACSLPLHASVFHVAPGGDDANDGSDWGQALATISHADAVLDGLSVSNGYVNVNGACGAGVHLTAGTIRNSLIVDCYGFATGNGNPQGGGIWMSGGKIESCTLAGNESFHYGGGVFITSGSITNAIIYENGAVGGSNNVYATGGLVGYSCASELTDGLDQVHQAQLPDGFLDSPG